MSKVVSKGSAQERAAKVLAAAKTHHQEKSINGKSGEQGVVIPAPHVGKDRGQAFTRKLPVVEVLPHRCKPWKHHNRSDDWLNISSCDDLIKSIASDGQQEPALLRELSNDPDFDYEIIYGVRRWFACKNIPNQRLLAYVTEKSDRDCMILMHVENANSKDISDMERAVSFRGHLKSGVFKNQKELSKDLNVSDASMTRYMQAASIYDHDWIVDYLPSIRSLSIRKAASLSALLNDRYNREKIMGLLAEVQPHEVDKKTFINKLMQSCEEGAANLVNPVYLKISHLLGLDGITSSIDSRGNLLLKVDAKFKGNDKKAAIKQISDALLIYAEE